MIAVEIHSSESTQQKEAKEKHPTQHGHCGKSYKEFSRKSKHNLKKAVREGLQVLGDTLGFSKKRDGNLIIDAILDDITVVDTSQKEEISRYRSGLKSILDTYFSMSTKSRYSPRQKYCTLSALVAFDFTYEKLNRVCTEIYPSDKDKRISNWQWRCARAHYQCFGAAGFEPRPQSRRNAFYKKSDLEFMIGFLYSKKCLHSVAYGTHKANLSDGRYVILPSLLRWQTHKYLYQSYKLHCEANSKVPIKRTTFDFAVNTASKQDDRALSALDSVGEKCGTQNFVAFRKLISVICKNNDGFSCVAFNSEKS